MSVDNSTATAAVLTRTPLPGLFAGLPELEQHFDRHQVPAAGREYVVQAATGNPARRLASRGGNIVVRFASRKMDAIVQAASRTTHLPFVETCEYDPGTILFVCQPGDLYVPIVDSRDRRATDSPRPGLSRSRRRGVFPRSMQTGKRPFSGMPPGAIRSSSRKGPSGGGRPRRRRRRNSASRTGFSRPQGSGLFGCEIGAICTIT